MDSNARTTIVLSSGIFVVSFFGFAFFSLQLPILYDADSYMHLAIARLYAESGLGVDSLPWARMSVMHDGYGDKELLFHLFLVPFTQVTDAAVGGRLALATLNAALVTLLAVLGFRAVGPWGLTIAPVVYLTATAFLPRAVRLRPELGALMILIVATGLAATGRRRWLFVAALLMTLSYTAFHVLVGLAFLWLLVEYRVSKRWEWGLAGWPVLGTIVGILIHPQFPKTLEIWWIQNALFFVDKAHLGVGPEILAPAPVAVVLGNAGFVLALVALWRAGVAADGDAPSRRTAPFFVATAVVFLVLYLFMGRMITYVAPFAALAVVHAMRDRRLRVGGVVAAGLRVPLAVALGLALVVSLPRLADPILVALLRGGDNLVGEAELERFGRAMPDGAKVATTWELAELYCFWAPQATYLNLFDPIFMARPHPEEFALQRRIFAGEESDVPLAALSRLDSDHIAFDRGLSPVLYDRIANDPRAAAVYVSFNVIAGFRPPKESPFVLDWRVATGDELPAVPPDGGANWPAYPRLEDDALRAMEGYVDLARVARGARCATFVREVEVESATETRWELAPWGSARIALDGVPLADVSPRRAILGSGLVLPVQIAPGRHVVSVQTCADEQGRGGFYLVER